MTFDRDVVGAIGRTPLIRLRAASEATGCTILGKAEFMNPGGSVKDRAALAIVRDAEERGALRPGGAIVGERRETPGSASPWSRARSATGPSSSSPTPRRRKRRTCCGSPAPS